MVLSERLADLRSAASTEPQAGVEPLVYAPQLVSLDRANRYRRAARILSRRGTRGIKVGVTERAGDVYVWQGKDVDVPEGFVRVAMTYPTVGARDQFWSEVDNLAERTHQEITGKPSGLFGQGPEQQALARRRFARAQRRAVRRV